MRVLSLCTSLHHENRSCTLPESAEDCVRAFALLLQIADQSCTSTAPIIRRSCGPPPPPQPPFGVRRSPHGRGAAVSPWICTDSAFAGGGSSPLLLSSPMAMATWTVLLLPPLGARRAQPRWLCPTGGFSLQLQRAWRMADPATARARLVPWLEAKGRSLALLSRMRLVQACSTPAEHRLQNGSGRSVAVEL